MNKNTRYLLEASNLSSNLNKCMKWINAYTKIDYSIHSIAKDKSITEKEKTVHAYQRWVSAGFGGKRKTYIPYFPWKYPVPARQV